MVECVQKSIRFPMRERERGEGEEKRRTRDVHINALAQKAHVRLSLEY